ncbi:MAG: hypothetical protein MZU97_12035 [Bacillus subtilis]|nr:hypothetical protein [Bacillus subtilis]
MNMAIGQGYLPGHAPADGEHGRHDRERRNHLHAPSADGSPRSRDRARVIAEPSPRSCRNRGSSPRPSGPCGTDLRGVITEGTARYPVNYQGRTGSGKDGDRGSGTRGPLALLVRQLRPLRRRGSGGCAWWSSSWSKPTNPWEWWAPYASNIIFQGIFAGQTYEEAVAGPRTLGT